MFNWWRKIAGAHRSSDETAKGEFMEFLFPHLNAVVFIRMAAVAVIAVIVFGFLLMPCIIDGESMMPTFNSHGFTFCKKWSYWFSSPQRSDVVIVSYTRGRYLLKRVVAVAGDQVEFRKGDLYINGTKANESYLHYASDWDLPPRTVAPGNCYVVGDNRSQHIDEHVFGQVPRSRIIGKPLF